jgi:hypothetical protein
MWPPDEVQGRHAGKRTSRGRPRQSPIHQAPLTNYFRQETVEPQTVTTATTRSVLLRNAEHNFFRLYF